MINLSSIDAGIIFMDVTMIALNDSSVDKWNSLEKEQPIVLMQKTKHSQ